jgi:hypothetical protein
MSGKRNAGDFVGQTIVFRGLSFTGAPRSATGVYVR